MPLKLRVKIFLISAGILCATLGVSALVSGVTFSREYSSALGSYAFVIGRSLTLQLDRLMSLHIPLSDLIGFDEQCREAVEHHPGISFARVVDPSGRILFHNDPLEHERIIEDPELVRDIRNNKETMGVYQAGGDPFYCAIIPVLGEQDTVIAAVNIGFPVEVISGKTRRVVGYSMLTAVIFFGIGSILLMGFMNHWVTRPLGTLLAVIQDIMQTGADSTKVVNVTSRDEIGLLGEAFNRMIFELKSSHREIREHAEGLEARVRQRTADLATANEKLRLELGERKRLEAAIEHAGEAIVITDGNGGILYVNPAFERSTGYDRKEVLSRPFRSFFKAEGIYSKILETVTRGEIWSGQAQTLAREGRQITSDLTVSPIRDASGEIISHVAVAKDVTRQAQIEKQLQQAQKMESIGTLAGGIAHDFNNLLSVIIGNTDLALSSIEEGNPLSELLKEINAAGQRASGLTRQILAFSRRQIIKPQVVSLNDILDNTRKIIGRLIGENIEVVTHQKPELRKVKVDQGQMEQVIFNLAVNARDAMPEGGLLIIETANVELDEAYCRKHFEAVSGSYVMMAVSDTGIGMDQEIQAHIFEPFFTTKDKGKGTGMGLATVYGIVKQNRGYIYVYSEKGRGATFKTYLPVHEGEPDVFPKEIETSVESLTGSETILVVEDDQMLRKMTSKVLGQHGYRVLEAQDGDQAIAISESHGGPIHLILTDVIMPGLNVREMARRLRSLRNEAKILYMSGYTDNAIAHYGVLEDGIVFISKPFTSSEILRKIRAVLDGAGAPILVDINEMNRA